MTAEIAVLLALWTACEAAGQVLFKRGVDVLASPAQGRTFPLLREALASPSIWAGMLLHGVEFVLWIEILGRLPLSVAFPLESVSFVAVLLASRVFLGEAVPRRRWLGVGLICAGIAVLGSAA